MTTAPRRFVAVVGMHRSGTSATAGTLAALGLGLPHPGDLMAGAHDNPVHYESNSLTALNDRLLALLGGSWEAPPPLAPGWEEAGEVRALESEAAELASGAFGEASGPAVWKDPRSCLLLPFWRRVLPEPLPVVFVWRSPLAVARSLTRRNGLSTSHGLSLWERYNREALRSIEGLPVFPLAYDRLVDDTACAVEGLAGWLEEVLEGAAALVCDRQGASALADRCLRHHGETAEEPLLQSQRLVLGALSGLDGPQEAFSPPEVGEEPAWVADLLAAEGRAGEHSRRAAALAEELESLRAGQGGRLRRMLDALSSRAARSSRAGAASAPRP